MPRCTGLLCLLHGAVVPCCAGLAISHVLCSRDCRERTARGDRAAAPGGADPGKSTAGMPELGEIDDEHIKITAPAIF